MPNLVLPNCTSSKFGFQISYYQIKRLRSVCIRSVVLFSLLSEQATTTSIKMVRTKIFSYKLPQVPTEAIEIQFVIHPYFVMCLLCTTDTISRKYEAMMSLSLKQLSSILSGCFHHGPSIKCVLGPTKAEDSFLLTTETFVFGRTKITHYAGFPVVNLMFDMKPECSYDISVECIQICHDQLNGVSLTIGMGNYYVSIHIFSVLLDTRKSLSLSLSLSLYFSLPLSLSLSVYLSLSLYFSLSLFLSLSLSLSVK